MLSALKSKVSPRIVVLLVFIAAFLITRLPGLASDTLNPDAVNWHYRSEQFINGLKYLQLEKTYQHYHPGAALMWIAGVSVEVAKHVLPRAATYNQYTFQTFDFISKYAVVFAQLILTVFSVFLLTRVFDYKKHAFYIALISVAVFTFEPFFVGNSRLYHMDVLFSLFTFNALLSAYLYIKYFRTRVGIVTGVLLALAFLTRSVGIGALLYVICFGGLLVFLKGGIRNLIKYVVVILIPFTVSLPLILPAFIKGGFAILENIFSEGLRIGTRNGHEQVVLGEDTMIAGPSFYFLVLIIRLSVFTWIGMVLYFKRFSLALKTLTKHINSPVLFLTIFYLGYFILFTVVSKKLDRYVIPLFPYFAVIATLGYYSVYEKLWGKFLIIGALIVFIIVPLVSYFPYYFLYASPVVGSYQNANAIVGFKPFGIGIYGLKDYINEKYGRNLKIGFLDPKPYKSIYAASKVKEVDVEGASGLDLIVLGPNEELENEKIADAFKYDSSYYIKGIAYWRVYVKKN